MLFEAKLAEPDAKAALSWEYKGYRWIAPEELKSLPKFPGADPYYMDDRFYNKCQYGNNIIAASIANMI